MYGEAPHDYTFIGLDVHARSVAAGLLDAATGEVKSCSAPARSAELVRAGLKRARHRRSKLLLRRDTASRTPRCSAAPRPRCDVRWPSPFRGCWGSYLTRPAACLRGLQAAQEVQHRRREIGVVVDDLPPPASRR